MLFKGKKPVNSERTEVNESNTYNVKQEMIRSLLGKKKPEQKMPKDDDITIVSNAQPPITMSDSDQSSIPLLISRINGTKEKLITPKVDFKSGRYFFPILTEIGRDESDVTFLDKLCDVEQILEKVAYEWILVCPQHPHSFSSNLRLYCPKCNSMDIKKLHLIEHIRCGYISEQNNFENEGGKIEKCPSCDKKIENSLKELRIPAKWYSCKNCSEKFDDVLLKMNCREFNHDFDINSAKAMEIPSYKIKSEDEKTNIDTREIFDKLKILLQSFEFNVTENYSIQGKSGHYHTIDIFGVNKEDKSIFIFVKKSDSEIDNIEINSKIIQVLDASPNIAILIGFSSISEKAKSIAASYNVSIVASQDLDQILNSTQSILTKDLGRLNKNEIKSQSN